MQDFIIITAVLYIVSQKSGSVFVIITLENLDGF